MFFVQKSSIWKNSNSNHRTMYPSISFLLHFSSFSDFVASHTVLKFSRRLKKWHPSFQEIWSESFSFKARLTSTSNSEDKFQWKKEWIELDGERPRKKCSVAISTTISSCRRKRLNNLAIASICQKTYNQQNGSFEIYFWRNNVCLFLARW